MINENIEEYLELIKKTKKKAKKIGQVIVEELKDIIPDLKYFIEDCPEFFIFSSNSRNAFNKKFGLFDLEEIISEIFPELKIATPEGVYLTYEEIKEVEKRLRRLKDERKD